MVLPVDDDQGRDVNYCCRAFQGSAKGRCDVVGQNSLRLPDTVVCIKAAVFRLLSEELFELLDGRTARDVFRRGKDEGVHAVEQM